MLVVVVDNKNIAGDSDFPELDLPKYGWEQFPQLDSEEATMRCWRAEVVVSASLPIDKTIIDRSYMLKLIVAAGDSVEHIDISTATARGIKVCHVPGLNPADATSSEKLRHQVIDIIDSFYKNDLIHEVNR